VLNSFKGAFKSKCQSGYPLLKAGFEEAGFQKRAKAKSPFASLTLGHRSLKVLPHFSISLSSQVSAEVKNRPKIRG
jgi:hypothetical protein